MLITSAYLSVALLITVCNKDLLEIENSLRHVPIHWYWELSLIQRFMDLFQGQMQSSVTETEKSDQAFLQRLFPDVKLNDKLVSM